MKTKTLALLTVFSTSLIYVSAWADGIWVAPTNEMTEGDFSNWSVTSESSANFAFTAPDNLTELRSAKVVLIGKKDIDTGLDALISLTQNSARYDDYVDVLMDVPVALSKDQLLTIDVSEIFPELHPGEDYISVTINTKFARIVGLDVTFSSTGADEIAYLADLQRETQSDLVREIENRELADANTTSKLLNEIEQRIEADGTFERSLTAERNERLAGDNELSSALFAEIIDRTRSDQTLERDLRTESYARMDADIRIENSIKAETQTRQATDSELRSEIQAINDNCTNSQVRKEYYRTETLHKGDTVLSACAPGFRLAHMQDMIHILDFFPARHMGKLDGAGWVDDIWANCSNWNSSTISEDAPWTESYGFWVSVWSGAHQLTSHNPLELTMKKDYEVCDVELPVWCVTE